MWIVALALRRPYTFVVVALLLLILGPIVIFRTPTDIFPNINIPVVSILWNYGGLSAEEMANRIVSQTERGLTTTVDDIQHSESQSLNGISVIKVFFQPGANIEKAIAQITAISQTQLRFLPAGTQPPLIITYSASTVPILQLALSGQKLSEQQLFDYGVNFIRTRLVTIPGCAIPWPYGGKQRQVQVDLDTNALQSKGLSPVDVVNAINVQNLILPSGTSKIGGFEYNVDLNGSPQTVAELNDLPIKRVGNTTIYIRDVAYVRDGFPPQTNIVRVNGHRASLLTIQKNGNASTLDIISGIKSLLPHIMSGLPPELKVEPLADQSLFVRASIDGVVREALIAACLTGVARYLFVPLAEAVVFAMLASYLLSRTLVPTMAKYLLRGHEHEAGHLPPPSRNPFVQMQIRFEEGFEKFRDRYHELLEGCLHHRRTFLWAFFIACIGSFFLLVPWLGRDFFPKVDAGQFKLHIRARAGTRIEETANLADRIESFIRLQIPL